MPFLKKTKPTLPSIWYYDDTHYKKELEAIWYQDWVCVGRLEDIAQIGDFVVHSIGNQSVIIVRSKKNIIRAFYNTCRHRGSEICSEKKGNFKNNRIICPYHTWAYSLSGELVATPYRIESDNFQLKDYKLYDIKLDTWGGFIFINLDAKTTIPLKTFMQGEEKNLNNWPLESMISINREIKTLKFNWKLFWENFSECYHCPRIHPELCKIVPIYGKGLVSKDELSDQNNGIKRGIGANKETWTMDGKIKLPLIPGPTKKEYDRGMIYSSFTASMYIVGHPDYVRSVRICPTGPETTDLVIDWLLMPNTKEKYPNETEEMLELGRLVVEQDGRACELNQKGLRNKAHSEGVLVAQEYWIWEFHEWVRNKIDAT